jgi:hypothetical protein
MCSRGECRMCSREEDGWLVEVEGDRREQRYRETRREKSIFVSSSRHHLVASSSSHRLVIIPIAGFSMLPFKN